MIQNLVITQLVENVASAPGLLGEHGASLFIEADEQCLLLDTGQGLTLQQNAARLGIALERVTAVVLSHGHYDHTGGLDAVIEITGARLIFIYIRQHWHQNSIVMGGQLVHR